MRPVYKFEVDWDGSGTFDGGAEDITSYVLSYSFRRGANPDTQLRRRSEPGALTLRLRNLDGRFSPFEAGSPLYGQLLPGRLVRVTAGVGSADHDRWTGYLSAIRPARGREPEAVLVAAGLLQKLQDKKISTPWLAGLTTGQLVEKALDYAGVGYQGVVAADRPVVHFRMGAITDDASGGFYTPEAEGKGVPNGTDGNGAALGVLGATLAAGAIALDSDGALSFDRPSLQRMNAVTFQPLIFFGARPWTVECFVSTSDFAASPTRHYIWSTGEMDNGENVGCWIDTDGGVRRISVERISNAGGSTVTASVTSDTFVKSGAFMHLVVTYDGAQLKIYIDGVERDSEADAGEMVTETQPFFFWQVPAWFQVLFATYNGAAGFLSCTLDEVAIYDHAIVSDRIATHYNASLTGFRRVEPGESTVGVWWADDEYALEAIRQVEDTEMGFLYEGADGLPVFEGRYHRLSAARSLTSQMTLSDAATATESFLMDASQEDPLNSVINEVSVDIPSFVALTGPANLTLRPSGAGASTQWSVFGAATNWEAVDEAVPDGDATAVFINVPGATDLYALPDTTPDAAISQVQVFMRAYGQFIADATAQIAVRSGGTVYLSDVKALAMNSYGDFSFVWTLDPATNRPWTKAGVDALQVGVRFLSASDSAYGIVTQVWAVITYEQPAPTLQWALGEEVRIAPGETVEFWARAGSAGYVRHWDSLTFPNDSTGLGTDVSIVRFRKDDGEFFVVGSFGLGLIDNPKMAVSFAEYARALRVRITNAEASKYVTLADWQLAGYAQEEGPLKQVGTENTESRRKYGPRTYPFPGRWVPDVPTALSYCKEIVSAYGEPLPVLTIPVLANSDDTLFAALIELELSDRITLVADNMHLKWGIDRDFFIEAIAESMDFEEGQLLMTLTLSPIPDNHVLLIDSDSIDSGARIGF